MIPIGEIAAHPDNPRKDLGDLTELAASIKAKGILQNLTVVELTDDLAQELGGEFVKSVDDIALSIKDWARYVCVIGHRRLAAARMAGLAEIPCTVAEMDLKEQVETMLMENIQRADLTLVEQAEGFQMMMDLGATVAGIAEKTGFGETTIRRRLAIAQLPSREVEKAVKKGATLMDFARLDKLQDPNHRAEALEYLGSHNFDFKLNDLIKQEEFIRNAPRVTDIIEAAGLHPLPEDTEYWEYRNSEIVYINDDLSAEDIPEWAEYFYWEEKSAWFRVTGADLRKQNNTPAAMHSEDEAARRKDCDERTEKLGQIMSQMHELRWNAVKDVAGVSELKLEEWAVKAFLDYGEVDIDYLNRISGISEDEYVEVEVNEGYGSIIQHDKYHSLFVEKIPSVKKRLLYAVYLIYEPGDNENRFLDKFATTVSLSKNGQQDLVQVYSFLRDVIGYQMSDVERSITYGSHELYDPQIRTDEPAGEEGSEDAA